MQQTQQTQQILCVDPGIISVGLFGACINRNGEVVSVFLCENADITKPFSTSQNLHTYISRFLQDYATAFCTCDVLVVEKQPVGSAGIALEVVIRERFLSKCVFVHPATLHKYYTTAGFTYDERKHRAVETVLQVLRTWSHDGCPGAAAHLARLSTMDRKHDCCDACLFFLYYVKVVFQKPKMDRDASENIPFAAYLEQFRYKTSPK
jgi:hypothetical protein